jgi:phospholipid/cholesterol/gamma-HCH transport system substrate-binding protein
VNSSAKRTNDFLVGASVIGVLVLLIAAILWLKQADIGGRTRRIVARSRDVGGVALGNPVVIRGVRAGRVESIALGENGWVVLTLSINRDIPLPADPVVLLVSSSLFGEWQATVTDRTGVPPDRELRAAIAEAGTKGDTLAGAVLADIAQLTSVAGRIAGDVAQVAQRVQVAFDDSAAAELRASIRNFSVLSRELSRTVEVQSRNLDRISSEVREGVQSVQAAAATVDRISSRIDSATSKGQLEEIVASARDASRALVDATTRLRKLTEDVDRTQGRLSVAVSRADSVFAKVNSGQGSLGLLVNDPKLYRNSDSLVTELRALVSDVRKNPRKYINVRIF